MADTSDFRTGMVLELDGELWELTDFQHVKPGKGQAFVRTRLRNAMTGNVQEKTFRAGAKVEEVRLVRRPLQFSYRDGAIYYFMDRETYEMIPLSVDAIGEDQLQYLAENMEVTGLTRDGDVLSIELPRHVELEVTDTRPGVKGDTAQGGTKPAEVASGAVVQVPLFIEEGDVIKIDRSANKYLERMSG